MKSLFLIALLAMLGLNVACSKRTADNDGIQKEEVMKEAGHEMDEVGDDVEDAAEELD